MSFSGFSQKVQPEGFSPSSARGLDPRIQTTPPPLDSSFRWNDKLTTAKHPHSTKKVGDCFVVPIASP